jgi:UDP-N-acetylglucosamine/UDP-N-acetylgalactosamine 4-epimerase
MQHDLQQWLETDKRRWLVTGSAGFIGSHLLEALLKAGQDVTSLDNFSTGYPHNLEQVKSSVGPMAWKRHRFIEGDIRDIATCRDACRGADFVLHQAALGSVPRSIEDPLSSHAVNVTGTLNMLAAARDAQVRRFVFAGSSATYGDHPGLPKLEDEIGNPLSPYAVTKRVDELYAQVFGTCYGLEWISLRYFNVFGPRQDPRGAYAAVIPCWTHALVNGEQVTINGDGETSRDFCYIDNVVQANLRAVLAPSSSANQVYNVAVGERTTLNELYTSIRTLVGECNATARKANAVYGPFRDGDVRHSLAAIEKASALLNYVPTHDVKTGLRETVGWFLRECAHVAKVTAPA